MKKLIIIAALSLVAAGCNKTSTDSYSDNSQDQNQNQSQNSDLQTYTNSTYGFEFMYPKTMQSVSPTYSNLENKIVQVQISKDTYPKTNFGDADFSVAVQSAKSLKDCLQMNVAEISGGFSSKVNINGTDFYTAKGTGAGAGNLYESNWYRTLSGQNCIELGETIHTSNIGNYPTGTVTEVDKAEVQKKLDDILNTFKLNTK
jgi:hypothetical protein